MTLNLANGTYRPYKKANESLLYINTSSSHPPQVIKQLPTSINERLSNNSSSEEILRCPKSNKLHKIFNRNTVKVSYCCTENLWSIIKTHNKKVTNATVETRTTALLMVTIKQVILYINALPQPPLIQTKYN